MGVNAIIKKHWNRMHDNPAPYRWLFHLYAHTVGRNHFRGKKGNQIEINCAKMDRCRISFYGTDNEIILKPGVRMLDCTMEIMGSHNQIVIGSDAYVGYGEFWISKDHNRIRIGKETAILGKPQYPTHLAAIEGTDILIGDGCAFSSGIEIRTADGHSIVDMEGNRINPSKSVTIGDHVWMGSNSSASKGVHIASHCIIGTRSVVTKDLTIPYSAYAGSPARHLKDGIDWDKHLLPIE